MKENTKMIDNTKLAMIRQAPIAARYSDYSTFGSTTNSKFGMLLTPTADLKVRATFAEGGH